MKIFTQLIYACGSEIGYLGTDEGSHYQRVMNRHGYQLEERYTFQGILQKEIVLLLNTALPLKAYQSKWKNLIQSIVTSMRIKCNFVDGET